MKIAVEGCAHGELDKIYECVETIQQKEQIKIDLLICCGDFQSVRNKDDLRAMAVPEKYQNICTFYKYYSGEKRAPVLTIFIGGNHEASNYLQELPYGGWVAPNIYYLGRAGVVRLGNLRIGGKTESNELGSMPAENLLHTLKPDYWFAAHLHCQFAAIVEHQNGDTTTETKFLALDKCLPKRRRLQILEVPLDLDGDKCLKYDAEWLAVLRNTNHLITVKNVDYHMPGPGGQERYNFKPTEEEKTAAVKLMGDMMIKEDSFVRTTSAYTVKSPNGVAREPVLNPQTVHFCEVLGIDDPLQVLMSRSGRVMKEAKLKSTLEDTVKEPQPVEVFTPKRSFSSLSLPAPVSSSPNGAVRNVVPEDSVCTPDNAENSTFVSDGADFTPQTPVTTGKKSFKRRNHAIYTPDEGDESFTSSGSVVDAESPVSSKLTYKPNPMMQSIDESL